MGIGKLGYAVLFMAALVLFVPVMLELAGYRVLPMYDSSSEHEIAVRRLVR
jgi:hypothetical protein